MRKIAAMAACGLLIACFVGCKSSPITAKPVTASPDEPKWVSMGASAFPDDAGKAFYGVGIAAANRFPGDPFMLRKAATERGRAEVAGQLQTMVAAVFKDYSAATFTPSSKQGEMQSMTEYMQKSVTDATLIGAVPVASWKDTQTGDMYVLIKLSMDSVAAQIRDKIISVEKDKLKMDADAAHKELDDIIDKNRQQQAPAAK
jgi:hypothetical protein